MGDDAQHDECAVEGHLGGEERAEHAVAEPSSVSGANEPQTKNQAQVIASRPVPRSEGGRGK